MIRFREMQGDGIRVNSDQGAGEGGGRVAWGYWAKLSPPTLKSYGNSDWKWASFA